MDEQFLLSVKDLRIRFGRSGTQNEVVKGISFSLRQGSTLGIVGESGSGKSVTVLSLMNLLAVNGHMDAKEIQFLSRSLGPVDLTSLSEKQKCQLRGNEMGMIFQEPMTSLNPVISCGKQVEEVLRLHKGLDHKQAKAEVLSLFEQVRLPRVKDIYKAYPHEISGGQKQRVMIAMAISCKPQLLIADEPTTALDVTVQKQILELLQELQDLHQMSMIFITHDLGVVAEVADEVLVMYNGEIVESGRLESIFSNAQHPYTQGLLACRPRLDLNVNRLPTIQDYLSKAPEGNKDTEVANPAPAEITDSVENAEILRVEELKTWFPKKKKWPFSKQQDFVKAVDGISFKVQKGETLGLVGESGCGKTTLGRSILHLIPPTNGEVFYEGTAISDLRQDQLRAFRKKMQIIFQDPYSSLNPRMTVGASISEPLQVHGLIPEAKSRKERVYSLLEKVGLPSDSFERYPHEFSGGQRQRVCIARALAVEPDFIICDESVSALDVSIQAQVLNLLKDLQDELGLTYIFISHDLSVVKFMSDRILVMRDGKMEELAPAEQLYSQPASNYTRELISAVPPGNLARIRERIAARNKNSN